MKEKASPDVSDKTLSASIDSVLQWFKEKARAGGREADAQHYADTQLMIRRDIKSLYLHGFRR